MIINIIGDDFFICLTFRIKFCCAQSQNYFCFKMTLCMIFYSKENIERFRDFYRNYFTSHLKTEKSRNLSSNTIFFIQQSKCKTKSCHAC